MFVYCRIHRLLDEILQELYCPTSEKKKNLEGIYMTLNLDPLSNALKVITGTSVSVIFKFIA